MVASTVVSGITGVKSVIVGDANGRVLEQPAGSTESKIVTAAAATSCSQMQNVGEQLGLGSLTTFTVSSAQGHWVIRTQAGYVLGAQCDGIRSATSVDVALQATNWAALIEIPVEKAERELPSANRSPLQDKAFPARPARPIPPRRAVAAPPPPFGNRAPPSAGPAGGAAYRESLQCELRRALVKGQLKQVEQVAAQIIEEAKTRNAIPDSAPIPKQFLEGIAMVLAGDAVVGLSNIEQVERAAKSITLQWAALIWCSRASTGAGANLQAARAHAEAALNLASQIDSDARAVATYELASIEFHSGNFGDALELAHMARSLFANTADAQLLANCWLLEARVLSSIGNYEESVGAAEKAREHRRSWPAPSIFIARDALRTGKIDQAEAVVMALSEQPPTLDVERTREIIARARKRQIPTKAAYEFLELLDAAPSPENVQKLESLADSLPQVEYIQDTLGWQLIKTGQHEVASIIFERLSARSDLSENLRSSVFLALGCIAAKATHSAKPGVRIRAAIDAAPKNFKLAKPLPPSGSKIPVPTEFRISDMPSLPNIAAASGSRDTPGGRPGPVFSGNLQLFGLPDLLEFLRSGQRTGTLVCSSSAGIGAIHMRRGLITGAGSPNTKGLKDYLIAMGVVTRPAMQKVDQSGAVEETLVGGKLVKLGLVTVDQVRIALRDQVRDAVRELMGWGVGQFAFDPEVAAELSASDVNVEFDPQEVLLNIFKEIDERQECKS